MAAIPQPIPTTLTYPEPVFKPVPLRYPGQDVGGGGTAPTPIPATLDPLPLTAPLSAPLSSPLSAPDQVPNSYQQAPPPAPSSEVAIPTEVAVEVEQDRKAAMSELTKYIPDTPETRTIYVYHAPEEVTVSNLEGFFHSLGRLEDITKQYDKKNNLPCWKVEFQKPDAARMACALDQTPLLGSKIQVISNHFDVDRTKTLFQRLNGHEEKKEEEEEKDEPAKKQHEMSPLERKNFLGYDPSDPPDWLKKEGLGDPERLARTVYVGNLPEYMSNKMVEDAFSSCGAFSYLQVQCCEKFNFSIIEFYDVGGVIAILGKNDTVLRDRFIRVFKSPNQFAEISAKRFAKYKRRADKEAAGRRKPEDGSTTDDSSSTSSTIHSDKHRSRRSKKLQLKREEKARKERKRAKRAKRKARQRIIEEAEMYGYDAYSHTEEGIDPHTYLQMTHQAGSRHASLISQSYPFGGFEAESELHHHHQHPAHHAHPPPSHSGHQFDHHERAYSDYVPHDNPYPKRQRRDW